jgi:hypothetical protein
MKTIYVCVCVPPNKFKKEQQRWPFHTFFYSFGRPSILRGNESESTILPFSKFHLLNYPEGMKATVGIGIFMGHNLSPLGRVRDVNSAFTNFFI